MSIHRKIVLDEKEMPTAWYNIMADMPNTPAPPLNPGTGQPATPDDFAAIFPSKIIEQEMSRDRWIEIPDEVQDILKIWRPTPLFRARGLEKELDTPAHIYYKWEGSSPAGSHKPNTAIAQAYYNKQEGTKRIATETGAGQWGSSLALAGALFGIQIKVYMVRVSFEQKPYRRLLMQSWGGVVVPSPSMDTNYGRALLAKDSNNPGSLGIAISEAVEDAATRDDTKYALGSVLNHVCIHQSVIGLETKLALEKFGEEADVVIGCHGGGSNFAGLAFPFIADRLTKGSKVRALAAEPASCPSLTKGTFTYDFGDTAGMTPLMKMFTLGHDFMPPSIHAGGLRYHGAAPLVSQMLREGHVEARAVHQVESFDAAVQFARTEGYLPAPESSHAIRVAIDEALEAKKQGKKCVIVFNLSGHGHFDLSSYEKYFNGELQNFAFDGESLKQSLATLPKVGF